MLDFFNQATIFGLMGGLGLFLFGMKIMSEGLQKVAGDRMRKILAALTNNRLIGTFVGLAVTAIIQSSSATTVMVIGFVNAGLMTLVQAIGVVLGANIGTTVTAQLLALKITHFALPAIGIGTGLKLFARSKKWIYGGEILLGFGILFFGLATMKGAFDPLKGSTAFHDFFLMVGDNYLLAIASGALLTIAVQSSSATIGITMALASSGLLAFDVSVALILGENIGTTITANLAAIGTNLAARRTALAHLLFNVLGVLVILLIFPVFLHLVDSLTPGDPNFVIRGTADAATFGAAIGDKPNIAWHIANAHSLFNIVNTLLFLPLIGLLAKLACLMLPGKDEMMEFHLKYIDNRVLNTPPIALGQARSETKRMAHITLEMLDGTMAFFRDGNEKHLTALDKQEEIVDLLQKEITDFLVNLSQKSITQDMSRDVASMMHIVNDLERVGDHCESLWKLAGRLRDLRQALSPVAVQEIEELSQKTRDFLAFVIDAFDRGDTTIKSKSSFMVGVVDDLEDTLRNNHISRLNTGECSVQQGLIYIDMLHGFSKIGSHAFNVSKAVIGDK
ncbi:sodium/phosphate symporter, putative [Syntrophotalea carbinolica DSM 2380]|uniref:Sodium/phosphate symporter, putative n=1 Tax=Syntrophotalea carbinolica (strain DSM 2380 / NBRC 103641 / GraBd1) TaxID=338963 RepID=Q3A497_SYNC1|nr:Na/Pi cotransporter family protein [Syntrophotalea carbinolica]ABA88810.1 sodium/phosphate symporter, putative [Syntrophotalea carbinolica DSM 2380]